MLLAVSLMFTFRSLLGNFCHNSRGRGKGGRVERRRTTHPGEWFQARREAQVYRKILVALDGSDAARAAFVFASDWARHFDSVLWFIQLTDESHGTRREIVTDVSRRGRQVANHFSVRGATRGQRNQQLVSGIAEAALTFGADMIIVPPSGPSPLRPERAGAAHRRHQRAGPDGPQALRCPHSGGSAPSERYCAGPGILRARADGPAPGSCLTTS